MPTTLTEIAKNAGVSIKTVSIVLNNSKTTIGVGDKTRKSVLEIANKLNYQPNHFAQTLRSGKTQLIGITTQPNYFRHPYTRELISNITTQCANNNYKLVMDNYRDTLTSIYNYDMASRRLVDGLIYIVYSINLERFNSEIGPKLEANGISYVAIHSSRREFGFNAIGLDTGVGGSLAARHFLHLGYTSLGYVNYNISRHHPMELIDSYSNTVLSKGIKIENEHMFKCSSFTFAAGEELAKEMISSGRKIPRALFVIEDNVAQGMIFEFIKAGIKVPEDVAIIGFGNNDDIYNETFGLTTIANSAREKGIKAVDMLMDKISNKNEYKNQKSIFIKPVLNVRSSCGAHLSNN